jgi:toxin CcdB
VAALVNRQFDVVPNPEAMRRPGVPFMILLQSHHLPMQTTIVAPIRTMQEAEGVREIEVPVSVSDAPHAIMVSELAHLPTRRVGRTVQSLAHHEDDFRRALDRLFTGF